MVVIDDDPSIREVAALSLSAVGGHEVQTRRTRPDVILLDVMMPTHDGTTVLAHIRADDVLRDVPVVFLTAKVGAADIRRLDDQGAAGVITKPFDPLELPQRLAKVLGWEA